MTLRKAVTESKKESNSTAYKKLSRVYLKCPVCPPNRGENAKRRPKHGATKPKHKDKRS